MDPLRVPTTVPTMVAMGLGMCVLRLVLVALLAGVPTVGTAQSTAGTGVATTGIDAPGEEQAVFLLQVLADTASPGYGMPLAAFRERIVRAVQAHPDTRAASAAFKATSEAVYEIEASRRPQISGTMDVSGQRNDRSTIFDTPARRYESGAIGLSLRQNVYDFGATNASIESGRSREWAASTRGEGRSTDLAMRAVQAWLEVYRTRRQMALAALNVQARETLTRYLSQRHALGAGLISDVWRAQSRVADARATVATFQTQHDVAMAAFIEIYGEPAGELALPQLPELAVSTLPADMQALVREFHAVRSAEARQREAQWDREAEAARRLPQLALELSARRRDLVGRGTPGNELSAALVLRYSFYTGGADTARLAQQTWLEVEATELTRNVSLQVHRSLREALAQEASAGAVVAARREEVKLAADALRAVRDIFANRRGNLLDLLNAQEVLNAAGQALVNAQSEQVTVRWRLLYLSGGLGSELGLPMAKVASVGAPASAKVPR